MAVPITAASVYRLSLSKLLTIHIALCFVVIGFFTLPVALVRRSKTKLIVSATNLHYQSGVASVATNDIALVRIDNVHTEQSFWDRMFGCGTLLVSAGGGLPTRIRDLERVERARADIQSRADTARNPVPPRTGPTASTPATSLSPSATEAVAAGLATADRPANADGSPPKPNLWRRFRGLPLWSQILAVSLVVVLIIIGAVAGGGSSTNNVSSSPAVTGGGSTTNNVSSSPAVTVAPPVTPVQATTAPTTRTPITSVPPSPLPVTFTNADFVSNFGFNLSPDLHLAGGVYSLTLTSDKPGPGVGVAVFNCGTGDIDDMTSSSLFLGKDQTAATAPTKSLKPGCYQLELDNRLSASATVQLSQ